ncbi:hypothetical protein RCL1_002614 [Eukaryota sp. TZLM3-RCL]
MASKALERLQSYLTWSPSSYIVVAVPALFSAFIECGYLYSGSDPECLVEPTDSFPNNLSLYSESHRSLFFHYPEVLLPIQVDVLKSPNEKFLTVQVSVYYSLPLAGDQTSPDPWVDAEPLVQTFPLSTLFDFSLSPLENVSRKVLKIDKLMEFCNECTQYIRSLNQMAPPQSHHRSHSLSPSQSSFTNKPNQGDITYPGQAPVNRYPEVGRSDLQPSTVGGIGGIPGRQQPGGFSESQVGREHPVFGHPQADPRYGTGLPPAGVPPGARFDPFGPPAQPPFPPGRGPYGPGLPGSPRGPFSGEPDPNHLKPPGHRSFPYM